MKGRVWWLTLAILFLLGVLLRQALLTAIVLVLALASAASELWYRHCLSNVSYRRRLAARYLNFGEETTLALDFTNAKPLPLAWLLVRDDFPRQVRLLTGRVRSDVFHRPDWLTNLVSLRWYERLTRFHRVKGDHRGVFQFGPAEMISGDLFGFRRQQRTVAETDTLVVYPKIVPLPELGLPAGRPMGEWLADRRVMEDPLRFAMVREYRPGDNPRHIHWKASARTGDLQMKVFEPSNTLNITFAVDVQTAPGAYEYMPEYLEYVISAAASLVMQALTERHLVGLCANGIGTGGKLYVRVPPDRRPHQTHELLTLLASLKAFRGMPFEDMLYELLLHVPFGGSVAAITAMPRPAVYEALLRCQIKGHPVLLLTVGDAPPDVPQRLPTFHLGGVDAWHRVEALELA